MIGGVRRLGLSAALAISACVGSAACWSGETKLVLLGPEGHEMDRFEPSGDTVQMRALLLKMSHFIGSEYPQGKEVRYAADEATWRSEDPDIASVSATGRIVGHRPGSTLISVRIREFRAERVFQVGVPLDSVAFAFVRPVVAVGDTVELRYLRFFADGSVMAGRGAYGGAPATGADGKSLVDVAHEPPGPSSFGSADARTPRAYVARQPGTFSVLARTHGRAQRAVLQITPATERPPSRFRSLASPVRATNRRPVGCFQVHAPGAPPDASDRSALSILPARLELDATPIVPTATTFGSRINAMAGDILTVRRRWWTSGDSLFMAFESLEDVLPHHRVTVRGRRTSVGFHATLDDDDRSYELIGQSVPCDPAP